MNAEPPQERSSNSATMGPWDAAVGSTQIFFGPGRMSEAGGVVCELEADRVLIVSDVGLQIAGHLDALRRSLEQRGLVVQAFTDLSENPTTLQVEAGVDLAAPFDPDCIVALGGGSAMDCAKGINFLLTNGGSMSDYWGYGLTQRPLLPAVGIPSTAGTGSEAQSYALITDPESHRKMACGDPSARFRAVILDPELLVSVPPEVAASTGLDAVSHAVESYVSTRRNPISDLLATQAWRLLATHLQSSLSDSATTQVRGEVLLGAHLAGAAIEQSMLGAAHACANPLTAAFGVPHGQAVAVMLPAVIRFNGDAAAPAYEDLAEIAGAEEPSCGAEAVALKVERLRRAAGLKERLEHLQIPRSAIDDLAVAAAAEWTARFNPRPVGRSDFESLYESAY